LKVTQNRGQILVIDIGGANVKLLVIGQQTLVKKSSGPEMTPKELVAQVQPATVKWKYARISIGYPGPVLHGKPVSEPRNLGAGWIGFDFERSLGSPVRLVNDAAMQAIGSYEVGRMLFLGWVPDLVRR
jgi:predicted NBD/HSP70 family sugar kinase